MKIQIALLLFLATTVGYSQEISKDLKPFDRIIASPRVNLVLKKGEKEDIRLVYNDINKSKINIIVTGKTLHIYLDDARRIEKTERIGHGSKRGIYEGVSVTAYVTYTQLESLEMRGKQDLTCLDAIEADRFTLKAYGENNIILASLKTDFFKVALYGENKLWVKSGKVIEQKYKVFGVNRINTREMKSAFTTTNVFGEGIIFLRSTEEVRVNAFGEPLIEVDGGANINRRLVFGDAEINSR
jgi:hypothetical protein